MSRASLVTRFSALVSPYVWGSVAAGVLLVLLAVAGIPALPLAIVGAGVCAVGGIVLAHIGRSRPQEGAGEPAVVPSELAADAELSRLNSVLHDALIAVASQPDGSRKDAVTQKLVALGVQFRAVSTGAGSASGSESWHVAHDAVLAVPDLMEYRAVIRVWTPEVAQDAASQESLRATLAAARRGVLVERILVLPDALWAVGQHLPAADIRPWIESQQAHGFRVILVRERDLGPVTDPVIDICVFDDWAVGTRDLDANARTTRVVLDFAPAVVRAARDRLDHLSRVGIPFGELLDRADRGG